MIVLLPLILSFALKVSTQILELGPGKVNGFEYETKAGNMVEVFLNIPYAAPPVDELRFEKPAPVASWDIRNGTAFGPSCHWLIKEVADLLVETSEDCLTLNIIRPKKEPPSTGFPIIFFIHGGAFQYGSPVIYGYDNFANIYAEADIIVVTVQYRLGVYGFFSAENENMPGNLGLYDLAEALKFVRSNANKFGGDLSRITVWGHSAGSAAAAQLILSPMTRDYITRSIEMSGSAWSSWALGANVVNNSLQLAQVLGCDSNIKECIKQKSAEEIFRGIQQVGGDIKDLRINKWGPVIDGEFLQHPEKMAAVAPSKASLVGLTNKEASLLSLIGLVPTNNLNIKPADYSKWDKEKLTEELKRLTKLAYSGEHLEEVTDEIIRYYVDRRENRSTEFYIDRYTEFLSDLIFNVATVDGIATRAGAGWHIYAYILDHYCDDIWDSYVPVEMRGAPHAHEHAYVFEDFIFFPFEFHEGDQAVKDIFHQSIIEFVRSRTPSNSNGSWPEVGEELRYLRIAPDPEIKSGLFNESSSFWHKVRDYGFDMIQLLPTSKTS